MKEVLASLLLREWCICKSRSPTPNMKISKIRNSTTGAFRNNYVLRAVAIEGRSESIPQVRSASSKTG